jgi:hypothetical protein
MCIAGTLGGLFLLEESLLYRDPAHPITVNLLAVNQLFSLEKNQPLGKTCRKMFSQPQSQTPLWWASP